MERYLASLIIQEMQIKTTIRYAFILTKMVIIKTTQKTSVGEDMKKLEPLCNCKGCEMVQYCGKQYGGCFQN